MKRKYCLCVALCIAAACAPKEEKTAAVDAGAAGGFTLASGDFEPNGLIPEMFTCEGENVSPALLWANPPAGAKSFILTVRDPDAPGGDFLHWAVVDIPASASAIARGAAIAPPASALANNFGNKGYGGPCPPSGTHRYVFTLHAMSREKFGGSPVLLYEYLAANSLGKAELTGRYGRK